MYKMTELDIQFQYVDPIRLNALPFCFKINGGTLIGCCGNWEAKAIRQERSSHMGVIWTRQEMKWQQKGSVNASQPIGRSMS